ncbi:unnamed protein product [Staurois parvus]|uniref:Uncharacterized protein n=1 Tax=Staurois parvus TaxID=386267 RepID=A0ABN9FD62_9NEOB|nr:unnamed protein product [Staurois parvus]
MILPTDTNDGALFLTLTLMMGHHGAPSLVKCPIIGVSGRNSAPSLVSVGGIVPHH